MSEVVSAALQKPELECVILPDTDDPFLVLGEAHSLNL